MAGLRNMCMSKIYLCLVAEAGHQGEVERLRRAGFEVAFVPVSESKEPVDHLILKQADLVVWILADQDNKLALIPNPLDRARTLVVGVGRGSLSGGLRFSLENAGFAVATEADTLQKDLLSAIGAALVEVDPLFRAGWALRGAAERMFPARVPWLSRFVAHHMGDAFRQKFLREE